MVNGSTTIPGALVMVNTGLADSVLNRLAIQLHIDEIIDAETFDIRLAADPNYVYNVRTLRRRVMVTRTFQDLTNREYMDVVLYVKHGMASIAINCFGVPGQTYLVSNLTWGSICIYNTDPYRTCLSCGSCSGSCGCCDGYCGNSPYYPARYDPCFPAENHPYNQVRNTGTFGRTYTNTDRCLCGQYQCSSDGCIGVSDCRTVKS
jgi:hypothetical protein